MAGNGNNFTYYQREILRQTVALCEIEGIIDREVVLSRMKAAVGKDVSMRYLDNVKKSLRRSVGTKLEHLRKQRYAYIEEIFFKRVKEIEEYKKTLWGIIRNSQHNPTMQKDCIKELHQLTITLANMYEALPSISGITFLTAAAGGQSAGARSISEALQGQQGQGEEERPIV